MKDHDLILRIIQLRPRIARTRLAKLAYLFDLACVQLYGKRASEIPFRWHKRGPYCEEIAGILWDLEESGKIGVTPYKTVETNFDCWLHEATVKEAPHLSAEKERILRWIVETYGDLPLPDLLEHVYATPPMRKAQEGKRFSKLDMKAKSGAPPELYDPTTVRMLLRSSETPRSKYVPADEVFERLKAVPLLAKAR